MSSTYFYSELGQCNERNVFLHEMRTFRPSEISTPVGEWVNITLFDSKLKTTELTQLAEWCLSTGCKYFTCSGPQSEDLVKIIDTKTLAAHRNEDIYPIVMSHAHETDIESLWDGIYMGFGESLGQFPEVHIFYFGTEHPIEEIQTIINQFKRGLIPEEIVPGSE